MIEIELNQITKNYGYRNILNGFCMEIKTGERVALIGKNGSGKSTILKIIAKQEHADSGMVHIRHDAKIGYLKQNYENEKKTILVRDFLQEEFRELSLLEQKMNNMEIQLSQETDIEQINKMVYEYGRLQERFEQNGGYQRKEKFDKICTKFFIDQSMLEQYYEELSGGEKTRVNLARLLLSEPDILLLDEPTNYLDIESVEFLEELLILYSGTVLIVSHDRYFLDRVITKTVLIESGKANVYLGNYSYFLEEDEKRTLAQFAQYKSQQKQIKKMKESIATLRKFGDLAKNEMFFKRANSIEKRLEKIEIMENPDQKKQSFQVHFQMKDRSGKDVVTLKNVTKQCGDKVIFRQASFVIRCHEKIAIVGKNGCGKSTLIKMILGEDSEYEGTITLNPSVKIGYISQMIQFENEDRTILEEFITGNSIQEGQARNILARYGFRKEEVFKKIGTLSGGEKVRLMVLKLMQQDVNFLVLDEPTNHIDITTRELLEEALEKYQGTVLFVSHDRFFIRKIATKILTIHDEKISYTIDLSSKQ